MKKNKFITTIITISIAVFGLSIIPTPSYALDLKTVCDQDVPQTVKDANGCNGSSITSAHNVVISILNGIIGILSLVAVIFVIVGAVNYMTSAGDVNKLQKAKNTILYAVIGLIIGVLSFAIVNFVITDILGGGESGGSSSSEETESEDNSGSKTKPSTEPDTPTDDEPVIKGGGAN